MDYFKEPQVIYYLGFLFVILSALIISRCKLCNNTNITSAYIAEVFKYITWSKTELAKFETETGVAISQNTSKYKYEQKSAYMENIKDYTREYS